MANTHGKDSYFSLDNTADSPTDVSAYIDTSALNQAIELADTTAYADEDRTFIAGLANANIPIGGPWDATFDGYMGTTAQLKVARDWIFGPAGSTAGFVKYSGSCQIENYTIDAPVGERVSWSGTLRVSGAVTRGTF